MNALLHRCSICKWTMALCLFALLNSCHDEYPSVTFEERKEVDDKIKKIRVEKALACMLDSLEVIHAQPQHEVDPVTNLTHLVVLRRLGKIQRDESRFDEALSTYNKG